MLISSVIEARPVASLQPYRFTHTKLPELSTEDATRLRESLAAFPPGAVNVPLQGLPDGRVVIGQKRLALAKALGLKILPYQVIEEATPDELERWAAYENRGRRSLTKGQLIQLALGLRPKFAEQARARQVGGRAQDGTARRNLEVTVTSRSNARRAPQTRDRVAGAVGMSGRTFERGAKVLTDGPQALREQLLDGTVSPAAAYQRLQEGQSANGNGQAPGPPSGWTTAKLLSGLHKVTCLIEEQWPTAIREVAPDDRALVGELLHRIHQASEHLLALLEARPAQRAGHPPDPGAPAGINGHERRERP